MGVKVMRKREDPDETVWGKSRGLDPGLPPYPLIRHLLDAVAMAMHLWDVYLSENQRVRIADGMGLAGELRRARTVVGLCAGLHDIGKLSGFQFCSSHGSRYLSAELGGDRQRMNAGRFGHDVAGLQSAMEALAELGFADGGELRVAERLAEVIGGHHGRFHRAEDGIAPAFLGGEAWARQRVAHAAVVHELLGEPEAPGVFKASAAVLVTGVVILADWLVSQEEYLRERQRRLEPVLVDHFARAQQDAPRLLVEAGLARVELQRKGFAEAYGIRGEPNPLQRAVVDELRQAVGQGRHGGILLVTAAPGDGKSEAALEAERILSDAFGTQGYAFLLPTMATSDQMHGRVAKALSRQSGEDAGLTLVHSMAWLNSAYADEGLSTQNVLTCDGDEAGEGRRRADADMRPQRWLRGPKRPLLAQFAVGTIDQAMMAVLPVRHNALRLLALSGKTFIVDEAHAYDPYMQVLLGRLLNWLGAYGVPVVLLSATLPASVGDRLIKEYLKGAGHKTGVLKGRTFRVPYPGWLYVDGESGQENQISDVRRQEQARARSMELGVVVEPVVHGADGDDRVARLAVIERLLEPVGGGEGGTALVVCNTAGDAQDTYVRLLERFDGRSHEQGGSVQLLHARFPGDVREARTREVTEGLGREGPRPLRRIVVATQVVEQSLDLDADIVISDLAPLSLLLQRAGRCWRHENHWVRQGYPGGRGRPAWAGGPRLVVLDPIAGEGKAPRQWGEVYSEHLLSSTSRTLAEIEDGIISIPGDIQGLVEAVHGDGGDFDWNNPGGSEAKAWTEHKGKEMAERSMAGLLAVPRARSVSALHDLHNLPGEEDEWEVSTRLGADSVRLLCAYAQEDGRLTLDVEGEQPFPQAAKDGKMSVASVREVMRRTIPVRSDWLKDADPDGLAPPESWTEHPMLGELRVLRQSVRGRSVQAVDIGGKSLRLDNDCGLVRR
ncbi:CRISPR-associated helicase Cas3' [Streptomyces sp. SM1]|uniref:CRISPR-associated helicase Cas3' n=1 Tax=Streptomyces sp. SM1 TaxID=402229 RepID=UPI0021564D61|nr:CRISPR-associated helicase Cas3' [Streptomyces sp. SM1]